MSRYSGACVALIGLCLLWLCVREAVVPSAGQGAGARPGKVVRAGRFDLAGADGKLRGQFSASEGLVLLDKSGKARARLAVSDDGGIALEFLEADGESARAALRVAADGSSSLTLVDARRKPRAKLNVEANGATDLRFYGGDRRPRVGLSASEGGPSSLFLYDAGGRPCAELEVAADGAAQVVLFDS